MAKRMFKMEELEMESGGACLACGETVESGIEPDACGYECEVCGKYQVYGAEELLIMGHVE